MGNSWFIRDYENIIYNMDDVTDDGEIFTSEGWIRKFYDDKDLEIIRYSSYFITQLLHAQTSNA
jgi:hypothetical protein